MKIRIISDLHLEFMALELTKRSKEDKDTVLVLAGDIFVPAKNHYMTSPWKVIEGWTKRFKHVCYVLGNHEYYQGGELSPSKSYNVVNWLKRELPSVNILEKDTLTLDKEKIIFIGATLWTDFFNGDENEIFDAQFAMADFKTISFNDDILQPKHLIKIFDNSRRFIFEKVMKYKELGYKTVVVTHHGPSELSIAEKFKHCSCNGSFVSNILDTTQVYPDIWIHGHTHSNHDYIHPTGTRVICNPRGYTGYNFKDGTENPDFDSRFSIDI